MRNFTLKAAYYIKETVII